MANLTDLELTNVTVLYFDDGEASRKRAARSLPNCKTFPGDLLWPNQIIWQVLNLVTGGSLIKTVPIGAACYDDFGNYDATRCSFVLGQWTNSSLQ